MPYVIGPDCILCGVCISGCEVGAISEGETQAIIGPDVCIDCGTCEVNCPCQAISRVEDERAGPGQS